PSATIFSKGTVSSQRAMRVWQGALVVNCCEPEFFGLLYRIQQLVNASRKGPVKMYSDWLASVVVVYLLRKDDHVVICSYENFGISARVLACSIVMAQICPSRSRSRRVFSSRSLVSTTSVGRNSICSVSVS